MLTRTQISPGVIFCNYQIILFIISRQVRVQDKRHRTIVTSINNAAQQNVNVRFCVKSRNTGAIQALRFRNTVAVTDIARRLVQHG